MGLARRLILPRRIGRIADASSQVSLVAVAEPAVEIGKRWPVESESYGRVAHPLLNLLRMRDPSDQQRGAVVPEIVETESCWKNGVSEG